MSTIPVTSPLILPHLRSAAAACCSTANRDLKAVETSAQVLRKERIHNAGNTGMIALTRKDGGQPFQRYAKDQFVVEVRACACEERVRRSRLHVTVRPPKPCCTGRRRGLPRVHRDWPRQLRADRIQQLDAPVGRGVLQPVKEALPLRKRTVALARHAAQPHRKHVCSAAALHPTSKVLRLRGRRPNQPNQGRRHGCRCGSASAELLQSHGKQLDSAARVQTCTSRSRTSAAPRRGRSSCSPQQALCLSAAARTTSPFRRATWATSPALRCG